jgi:FkbM family methyltransferase
VHRAIEAAHVVGWCAADGASRGRLLAAYHALARRNWSPRAVDVRVRMNGATLSLRFREQDIYVIGEILHDRAYRIHSELPPRPVIVDAGANIGVAALWLASRYPGAKLHCFEPESRSFALLEHNLRQLPGARSERSALGADPGTVSLYVSENGSVHSIFETESPPRVEVVRSARLGDYMERNRIGRVDLLKVDVEGSEMAILRGLGVHIAQVGVIVGELHERLVDETEFYAFLRQHGFRVVAKWPAHHSKDHHMFEVAQVAS